MLNAVINDAPDCVSSTVLSRSSLSSCTCGASSEPNVAVAIRHPPELGFEVEGNGDVDSAPE